MSEAPQPDRDPATEAESLEDQATEALSRVRDYFLRTQHPDGYWWGELESNPTMEAEYVMLTRFLGSDEGERILRVAEDIRRRQSPDGSWRMYYGAPGDLSTTIECYFALKLAGTSPDEPAMIRARDFILAKGGIPKARIFTKIWLALFGQWDWRGTPAMPPELMLVPTWAPFNLYKFASWARATIVPTLILLTQHPTRPVPAELALDELYLGSRADADLSLPSRGGGLFSLERAFVTADRLLRWYEKVPWKPLRGFATRRAERWITEHQEADGSWGGIQPPWVYSLMALSHLGRSLDEPVMAKGLEAFRQRWSLPSEDGEALRVQACLSPVWDTALATLGLLDSGLPPDHEAIQRATRWFIREEIRVKGDWAVLNPGVQPSGWAFEFENDMYPDIDDSSIIVMDVAAARMTDATEERARLEVLARSTTWMTRMRSKNGGWGAFDKDNDASYLAKIPFADFGELLDPPSVDVTAHVIEMFGRQGYAKDHPAVARGLGYIWREQEADGAWFGRWGVNYVYGIGSVLPALAAVGEDMTQPRVRRAVDWLVAHQNDDGGWGESPASYVDPSLRGQGDSTASQTAWALVALLAAGDRSSESTRHGIAYLVRTQLPDGTWDEPQFTGCGFPGYGSGDQPANYRKVGDPGWQGLELGSGFMINYHLYRNYFPLWALGRYVGKGSAS
ncbi:MAG: squalene--hopene cyclase [Chloroflexi bacterium]|nr:squalene--hopene cyclase [Chloroflexota bacterium]MDA1173035.1 squalene--hopene cyclase [Chloroflexota bacterium]